MRQLIDQLRKTASPWRCCWAAARRKVTLVAGISRDLEREALTPAIGFARRPKSLAAAAAASPTWPKPAASTPKN